MNRIFVLAFLSGAALTQEFPMNILTLRDGVVTADCGPPRPARVIEQSPYSTTLASGRYWRDSRGRVRLETLYTTGVRGIAIFDPVGGFAYLLDKDAKVARRMKLPPAGPSASREEPTGKATSRAEADPALFRPPAGYRVVDEPVPFTMTIRLP